MIDFITSIKDSEFLNFIIKPFVDIWDDGKNISKNENIIRSWAHLAFTFIVIITGAVLPFVAENFGNWINNLGTSLGVPSALSPIFMAYVGAWTLGYPASFISKQIIRVVSLCLYGDADYAHTARNCNWAALKLSEFAEREISPAEVEQILNFCVTRIRTPDEQYSKEWYINHRRKILKGELKEWYQLKEALVQEKEALLIEKEALEKAQNKYERAKRKLIQRRTGEFSDTPSPNRKDSTPTDTKPDTVTINIDHPPHHSSPSIPSILKSIIKEDDEVSLGAPSPRRSQLVKEITQEDETSKRAESEIRCQMNQTFYKRRQQKKSEPSSTEPSIFQPVIFASSSKSKHKHPYGNNSDDSDVTNDLDTEYEDDDLELAEDIIHKATDKNKRQLTVLGSIAESPTKEPIQQPKF